MSDTPIDADLQEKVSFRNPEFLSDRVESFKEAYNEQLRDLDLPEAEVETHTLDSTSEAYRRLLDIGLGMWETNGLPFGYTFAIEMLHDEGFEPDSLHCPECGEQRVENFRATVDTDAADLAILNVQCTECETTHDPDDVATTPLVSF